MWLGFAAVEVLPSPKAQEYRRADPPGSFEPALEKFTVSGAGPLVRSAAAFATGAAEPPPR